MAVARELDRELIDRFNADARPLSSEALDQLRERVLTARGENAAAGEQIVQAVLAKLANGTSTTVSAAEIAAALDDLHTTDVREHSVQVLDAFSMPLVSWDRSRRRFYLANRKPSRFPAPTAKADALRARLQLVEQRVLRGSQFQAPAIVGASECSAVKLTQVKALVGSVGQRRVLLGQLRYDARGHLLLEDASGTIPVSLTAADASPVRGALAEGMCLLVEGELRANGTFDAHTVADPPLETRARERESLQGLDISGATPLRPEVLAGLEERKFADEAQRIVLLAGCHLNDAAVLRKLGSVFRGYEGLDEGPPAVFVLTGPFFERSALSAPLSAAAMRHAFGTLAAIIGVFPNIQAHSTVVLVPGRGDAGDAGVLPQPPLLRCVAQPLLDAELPVVLASNPCRVRLYTKEVVVLARPRVRPFQQHSLRPTAGDASTSEEAFTGACHAMVTQSHLCPFVPAVQPVLWDFDGALALFPQPDALVITEPGPVHSVDVQGVQCISPGSIKDGTFAAYIPVMPADTNAAAADGGAAAGPSTSQLGTPAHVPPASPDATQLDAGDGDAEAARCAVEVCEVPDDEEADSDADSDSLAGSLEEYLADDGAGGSARQRNAAQSIAATDDEEEEDDFEVEEPLPLDELDGSDQNESDEDGGGGVADGAGLGERLAAAQLSAGGGDEAMAGDDDE